MDDRAYPAEVRRRYPSTKDVGAFHVPGSLVGRQTSLAAQRKDSRGTGPPALTLDQAILPVPPTRLSWGESTIHTVL